jgi:integrase
VVTINGRDVYLGRYSSMESREVYNRLLAEWFATGRAMPRLLSSTSDLTVNELALSFVRWAESYYVKRDQPTREVWNIKASIKTLRHLYGSSAAREFGPLALTAVREAFIASAICRNEVNRRTRIIVRMFRWAVENELVPPSVHHGLKAVTGLRLGRCNVRESKPVRAVPDAFVDAIRPYVSRQIWAMIQLQRLSGMRPGEVVSLRTIDVETSGRVWTYRPEYHKTQHHGRSRVIHLGPQAQDVLRSFFRAELTAPIFSPAEATAERLAEMRSRRKTRVQPSQVSRAKRHPQKRPGWAYTVDSYRRAISYGIGKANAERIAKGEPVIPAWHPNQLRHNAATRLRREFDLDVARAVLGHSSPVVTEIYAEIDSLKAIEAMERVG